MNFSRIALFFIVFVVPLGLIYTVATGDNTYGGLPFFGKEQADGKPFKINDFSFEDINGKQINNDSFKGEIMVVSNVVPTCPTNCNINFAFLKNSIFDKLMLDPDFESFKFLSFIENTDSSFNPSIFVDEIGAKSPKWIFAKGNSEQIFDITFDNDKNLLKDNPDPGIGGKTYYKFILLIDKSQHLRGVYMADRYDDVDRLAKEMRLLLQEYKSEEKNDK